MMTTSDDYEDADGDVLMVVGYPGRLVQTDKQRRRQIFPQLVYKTGLHEPRLDDSGRLRVDWSVAARMNTDDLVPLPEPNGISGSPVWRFRRTPPDQVWSPERFGRVLGVSVSHQGTTEFAEPYERWGDWFEGLVEKLGAS